MPNVDVIMNVSVLNFGIEIPLSSVFQLVNPNTFLWQHT